jgi:FixJ family two-component response regulator
MADSANFSVAVIDDDESFCRSVRRWLHAATFRAAIYRSAEDFLADPDNRRFDCLLVDVQLGGMSGLDMHRRLIAAGNLTPVIFITAYDDATAVSDALKLGCTAFFRKTVDGSELLQAIGSVLPPAGNRVRPH